MTRLSPPPVSYTPFSILSLPPEILETVILLSTVPFLIYGPRSIAALAQTCQLFRSLIYNAPDSHLWREMFLSAFDDPRLLETKYGFPEHGLVRDWEASYKARVGELEEHALIEALFDAPPLPRIEHVRTDGIVPLPLRHRDAACSNSIWMDYLFTAEMDSFVQLYKDSSRLQWLYGPRFTDQSSRLMGRVVVYNMRYLSPLRCWGPFKPIAEEEEIEHKPAAALEIYGIRLHPSAFDEDVDDPDYVDSDAEADSTTVSPGAIIYPLLLFDHLQAGPSVVIDTIFPALPHTLIPDYKWLAAARLLLEENIKDRASDVFPEPEAEADFLQELVDLRGLEVLRMGGVPGYWDCATKWGEAVTDEDAKGKGKEEEEGWDWAAVEGEYRRVVCWMDYRQLLLHNLQGQGAASPAAARHNRETTRVFPMTLHVSGYQQPPPRPADYDQLMPHQRLSYILPIIEVEGQSTGSDVDADAGRRIWGTVRMIGEGTVRWSLTSAETDSDDPEWITESVQMGQPGSAMGFMGLWTGAEHEKTDPIGPCWAWKVNQGS